MKNTSGKTKKIIAAAFILGASVIGTNVASADSGPRDNHMSSFVNAIATKFNLKVADVQAVVDSTMQTERAAMDTKRVQSEATRLTKAVTDGKLTQAQVNLITAKQVEMKAFMDSLKSKTEAERKTAMKTQMDSLKKWANDNKIPAQFLMGGRGHMGGMGKKGR
jgi:hypothetical protein